MALTTGILLFDLVEELDFVGPYEVFGAAAMKKPGDRVRTCSLGGQPVRGAKGLRVLPDHALDDLPACDILVVPGGKGTRTVVENEEILDFVRERARTARYVTSVCTGSLVLNAAGLVTNKRVITHWSCYDELRALGPVQIIEGARYVVDGNTITAAGVSAGIDMALYVLGQVYDPAFAREVQKYIEYFPAPPYSEA